MFHALTHHPDLTQAQHRALPHISNTDLSTLKNKLLGQPRQLNPVALAYGSHFHTAVLEPTHYQRTDERGIKWTDLEQLATAVRRHRFCRDLLYRGQAEQTHTATHQATGLTVKVRPDLLGVARFIIIGVQKKSPFEVWQFEVTPAPGLIEQGRKKYERLMKAFV